MTKKYKKKLIEVAIPLEAINRASAREKSIRHGHPSTLHLWWARRPLAACRAVLFAQLVDDPSSHPEKFPTEESQQKERARLFQIMEQLVVWENSTNEKVLELARAEIKNSCGGVLPPVYDPFSGGCSIPLEAQRLGLPSFGSDLNPVAVVIGKSMIEIPPRFVGLRPVYPGPKIRGLDQYRHAEGMAEDLVNYGKLIKERALQRIGGLYPAAEVPAEMGGGSAEVIAWIWTRTVPSPDPAMRSIPVPIASSFLLASKKNKEVWLKPRFNAVDRTVSYQIMRGGSKEEILNARKGTKAGRGANFVCVASGSAITPEYVKKCGKEGLLGSQMMAIVARGKRSRIYLEANPYHIEVAHSVQAQWRPENDLPDDPRAFWTPAYGLKKFGDLFTERQLVALHTFVDLIDEVREVIEQAAVNAGLANDGVALRDGGAGALAYSEAICVYLSFAVSRSADRGSTICSWDSSPKMEALRNTFGRQAIPMTWDYAEGNPFSKASGNFSNNVEWVKKVIERLHPNSVGTEVQHDAQTVKYPKNTVVSSDPPYYDNIGYADLSDFFFAWMKPTLKKIYPELFGLISTPKSEELVATPYRHGSKDAAEQHFLNGMKKAISNMALQSSDDVPATIYYAFKQSEIKDEGVSSTGWATFLQAVIEAGYAVVGTWPMRTEMANRMIASGTNALANSVVLVCRKKSTSNDVVTRAEFIRALKKELPLALTELQAANIAPADMPQSSIGPGIGVFSRYSAVLESDDSQMTVKTALQIINRELDEFFSGIEGDFDPETRFAVTWFEQNGMDAGGSGTAITIAQARGISVESVAHAGIVSYSGGKVRILRRNELEADWSPKTDSHLTHWECCQYLIRTLEEEGEYEAAVLLKKMGSDRAEATKDVAYRLYDICDKKGWAKEGTSYNGLIAVWSELTSQAASLSDADMVKSGEQHSFL